MPKNRETLPVEKFRTFGELLRYARKRAHLTQHELGSQIGYHHSYISYLEKNLRLPDKAVLLGRIVPALGLETESDIVERLLVLSSQQRIKSPLHDSSSVLGNLPANLTPILGREQEIELACQLLSREDIRLLTVIGPPGVGKTKLALHIAQTMQGRFDDGAVFVDLTPLPFSDFVLGALSSALGFTVNSSHELQAALQNKNILIFFDNFEHVLAAAPQLLPILGDAPRVKILVTSREPLRIYGEQEFPLETLPLEAACQLFVDRARAINPRFLNNEENVEVVEICQKLSGLPLAIEVAAAQTRTLNLAAILSGLKNSNTWQRRAGHSISVHQKTLDQAIRWSYDLLSESEKMLFCRLSVFSGGWTMEAAQEICWDDALCPPSQFHEIHASLLDKSLIVANAENARFSFYESLRMFSAEMFDAHEEKGRVLKTHCKYYLDFSENIHPEVPGKKIDDVIWMSTMKTEQGNFRKALEWATSAAREPKLLSSLILSLGQFLMVSGNLNEARTWLDKALTFKDIDVRTRSQLLRFASDYAGKQGDNEKAMLYLKENMEIVTEIGDPKTVHLAMDAMARGEYRLGHFTDAILLFEKALSYFKKLDNQIYAIRTLNYLAICNRELGYLDRALELGFESMAIARNTDDRHDLAQTLVGLGEVYVRRHEYTQAKNYLWDALLLSRELGFLHGIAIALSFLAYNIHCMGDSETATRLESASQKMRKEIGVPPATPASIEKKRVFHEELKNKLGVEFFSTLWAEGMEMSVEKSIQLASMQDR
jgi:predicted ATPase/DNA-binding XRE family transcriptional regulator